MAEARTYIAPPVDIYQTEDNVVLVADMPGINREDLSIQISSGELTIQGTIPNVELDGKKYIHRERRQGTYYLAYTLGEMLDPEQTQAKVKDGVLTLTLGKKEQAKPREIQIEAVE